MRVSVSHNKPKDEVVRSVERSFHDLLRGTPMIPLKIEKEQRSWQGSTMTFSFEARTGIISMPVKGTVEVTERDVIIEADLGLLEKFIGGAGARAALENRVKGLLR